MKSTHFYMNKQYIKDNFPLYWDPELEPYHQY